MNEGRTITNKNQTGVALGFAKALNEYDAAREVVKGGSFKFSLDSKSVLSIQPNSRLQPEKS